LCGAGMPSSPLRKGSARIRTPASRFSLSQKKFVDDRKILYKGEIVVYKRFQPNKNFYRFSWEKT
ncbi:MAG: hypothetical protein LBC55_07000, partial [Desulfovibrio sp.]|nr:hypothetical protein [Desulfovibrio sp.]